MGKLIVTIWILAGVALIAEMGLFLFDRPLFCDIAMWGQINSVPAACIQRAIEQLK